MKRVVTTVILAASMVAASATGVLAAQPAGVTGHGAEVAAVAQAVTYVSGQARGAAVSAIAKTQGAKISTLAKAQGAAAAAAGKAKGAAAAAAGQAKGAAAAAAGKAHQP
ncbi:MAG: hypothetical protein ACYDAN_01065 [Candidatus Limnocylindrales bacterium]